jgi:uncharacterized low-complexity protein
MTKLLNKTLMTALSLLFFVAINPAQATENPFGMSKLSADTMRVAEMKDGKCGQAKCGDSMKKAEMKEGKCGDSMKKAEMEEGKCGDSMKKAEKKEGKCGDSMKPEKKEGKCGSM